jgi:hypothetical protein
VKFSIEQRAGDHETFAPAAFDSQIDKIIPVCAGFGTVEVEGKLVAAEVSDDGKQATLTIELPDSPVADEIRGAMGPMSLGWNCD